MPLFPAHLRPMLASLADAPLTDPQLVYEPKYDGIRAVVEIDRSRVRLWSRLGNEKTAQFPEIAVALRTWSQRRTDLPLILDGEIVALDARGEPAGFQQLQGRIHVTDEKGGGPGRSTAFIAFDILRQGKTDLRERPLTERRAALEKIFGRARSPILRISESVRGDGRALYQRALDSGWEGLIAKHAESRYTSGKRTPDWRKLKIVHEQEFVIGGWTEPRQARTSFGALLLGVYDEEQRGRHEGRGALVYTGHAGTGFNEQELARVMKLLKALETNECPFRERPKTNQRPHWVRPQLVAQVKFTEWTTDGKLRHPVYLGLRDDKEVDDVRRETASPRVSAFRTQKPASSTPHLASSSQPTAPSTQDAGDLVAQLRDLETARRDGTVEFPGGDRLGVTNLHKLFWPKLNLTKGDLFRYYAQAAPFILPVLKDRPLTMKRMPNGVGGPPFYQHRAPETVPPNVRVQHVPGETSVPERFIGGDLKTLLYMTQLASISQDPWFSRITSPAEADHVALDLDPSEGVPFARVLDVARWIHDELDRLGAVAFPKTSGADGLHIYIPLPPGTPYGAGLIFCQIVATVVSQKHPKVATVERKVKARGAPVYVDYLQNILGKTLASAYSARGSAYAGVSTPLTWQEVEEGVRREDFTILTAPERFRRVGDLWQPLRNSKGVDLAKVSQYAT